jgi:Ni,Fe-hydrogenase I large subunit
MEEKICRDGNRAVIAQFVASSWYRRKESDREPWNSHLNQRTPKVKQSPYRT